MAYMDYHEYQAIMKENDYKESKAVRLFLKRAAAFNKRKKILIKQEEADCGNQILNQYIKKTEEQRWRAVWDAIDCAYKYYELLDEMAKRARDGALAN